MAGGGGGLSPPRPALPPRSETWAASQQPAAASHVNPPQQASPQLADDPDSPVSASRLLRHALCPGKLAHVCRIRIV
jgi:hypothetical protein